MTKHREVSDPEALYGYLATGDTTRALSMLREAPLPEGAVGRHAAELLVDAVAGNADIGADDAELFVLLGRAGRLPVDRQAEAAVIERLLSRLQHDPARALAIARFRPDLAACAAVILQYGTPARSDLDDLKGSPGTSVTAAETGHGAVDAGRSIFRSKAERAFFEAVVRVFPDDLVCPNVALHAALSWERLQERLTAAERRVFFSALVDVVVFDGRADYRPRYFFELDSEVHDDHRRAEKDAMKDRIITVAGYRLLRVRPDRDESTAPAFERLLRSLPFDEGRV